MSSQALSSSTSTTNQDAEAAGASSLRLRMAAHLSALSRISSALLHDLRVPLNAMSLNLDLMKEILKKESDPTLRPRQDQCLEVMGGELVRLHRMLENLIGQLRQTGEGRTRFDWRAQIDDLRFVLAAFARRRGIQLQLETGLQPAPIEGQSDAVRQATLGLIVEVLQRMPKNAGLRVTLVTGNGIAALVAEEFRPSVAGDAGERSLDDESMEVAAAGGVEVARLVTEDHGGHLAETSQPDSKRIEMSLPLAPAAPEDS